jgi:hypothetical protein
MVKSITNEFLEMTYPDQYYKDVIEPAKLGKGPVPSKTEMLMKSQPFKAVSMPFREMMNPGTFGAFRSSGTPLASKAVSLGRTALGGPFGIGSLVGTGIGMGADAIARATNTPEEYEAMKEKARSDYMGTGYFDDVNISQDAPVQGLNLNDYEQSITANEPMSIDRFTGQVGPNKSNMNELAPLDMARFAGVSQLGRNDIDVEQVEELSGLQNFKNQISGLKDFLPFGPKSLTGMAARGLGSMFSDIAPRTYGYSQRTYDAMTPSQQDFVDDLYDPGGLLEGYNKISAFGRGPLGTLSNRLGTIQNTLAKQKVKSKALQQREQQISNAINETINRGEREALGDKNRSVDYGITGGPTRTDIDVADGGAESGGRGKIVCTMMNDSYGFGNFRNKIWLKHSRDLPKEYEVGYHTIFLPLVKFAKGKGKLNRVVKKTLEHIARHRTYDLKQEMKGKTHLLGRAYRKVLEPICFITGKIKSALGRG